MQSIPEYSSIIVISKEGELLLQLRDDKPTIADPNSLSLFAGRIELGETKEEAAHRELLEETELDIPNLKFLFTYTTTQEAFGRTAKSHIFFVKNIDKSKVNVHEGQGYRAISSREELKQYRVAPISEAILNIYFDKYAEALNA